jgi:hypothetical protein
MADDTRVTRARRGLVAVALACACLSAADRADAADLVHWGADDINTSAAWSLSTGTGVDVAVVDTGVMADHEELLGRIAGGGWGFDGSTDDSFGHGTAVAGIIAANADGKGISGVAPDASIVPFRAFADDSAPDPDLIVEGLDRAADSGAPVVNASFSTEPYRRNNYIDAMHALEAVFAAHPGTLFVTAAGNDGNDNDQYPVLPCNADAPNLICVGAYTPSHQPWDQSNFGSGHVDVLAPGTPIYSATAGGGYDWFAGTSMATAFISGEAALLFSRIPRLTPAETIHLILSTTSPVAAFESMSASAGRPDAYAALQAGLVDSDRDGVYDVVDHCPGEAYATADGCATPAPAPTATATAAPGPVPVPTAAPAAAPVPTPVAPQDPVPQVRSLSATVMACKSGHSCKTSATVKLTPDRPATVSLRVDRRLCDKRGRCHWSQYLTKAFSASTRGASVVIRGKRRTSLPKGVYRVVAVASSAAGAGKPVTKQFRVR